MIGWLLIACLVYWWCSCGSLGFVVAALDVALVR